MSEHTQDIIQWAACTTMAFIIFGGFAYGYYMSRKIDREIEEERKNKKAS